jgi:hypothetical protein
MTFTPGILPWATLVLVFGLITMSALVFSGHGWSLPVFNLGIRYRYDGGMEAIYRPELEQPLPYKQSSGDSNKGVSRNYTCIFTASNSSGRQILFHQNYAGDNWK